MYSKDQITRGIQNPTKIKQELGWQLEYLRSYIPHDIGIQGSYRTGNIGDRAIGIALQRALSGENTDVKIFGKQVSQSNARAHILGGGGVLHDWYGIEHLIPRLSFLANNFAVIGIGVPGFKYEKSQQLVSDKLAGAKLVTVRDDQSKNQLETVYSGKIYTTACPALTLDKPDITNTSRTGVNFRPWYNLSSKTLSMYFGYEDGLNVNDARNAYISNINIICDSVPDPIFIPFHKEDEKFAKKNLDIEVLPYKFSVEETLQRVNSVERMVATRYHSLIFSIICNKAVLAIGYAPKVRNLAERIDVSHYSPHKDIPIRFDEINNRDQIRQEAERNFRLIDKYLNDVL